MGAHIVLTNFGCELPAFEALAYDLRKSDHKVSLVFDPFLFDDRIYFRNKNLAYFFNLTELIIDKIVALKPDVVGMYLISDTYRWNRLVASKLKKRLNVPILVGGTMAQTAPEQTANEEWIDITCIGNGIIHTSKLLDNIAANKIDYGQQNFWFRKPNGEIIKNPRAATLPIDEELNFDKSLYMDSIPTWLSYISINSMGCPWKCAFCSQSKLQETYSHTGRYLEWRKPKKIVEELKEYHQRFGFKQIDFRDNTFVANRKDTMELLSLIDEAFGGQMPYKVMTHPSTMTVEIARKLKETGCYKVQFGVQTVNEKIREDILDRKGSDEKLIEGLRACDEAGLKFSIDHIFNLPGDSEVDQIAASRLYSQFKYIGRITCFWLSYFPGSEIVDIAHSMGVLNDKDVDNINSLEPDGFYLDTGFLRDKDKIKMYNRYHVLLRAMPFLSERVVDFILHHNLHKLFDLLPKTIFLWFIDTIVTYRERDIEGYCYLQTYWNQIRRYFWISLLGKHRLSRKEFLEIFNEN